MKYRKVIKILENREILLKGITEKTKGKEIGSHGSWSINETWFAINEKCGNTIS